MQSPSTSKGEQAVQTILDAAENLFLTRGYHGTSMRDIADVAGYRSVSALYNHFGDKETLFVALLHDRSPYLHMIEMIQSIEGDKAEVVLPVLFNKMTHFMVEHVNFLRLVLIDYLEFNTAHVQALLTELQADILSIYGRLEQIEDLRRDVQGIVLLRVMAVQIFGYTMTRLIMPPALLDTLPEETWKSTIIDVLLKGITQHNDDRDTERS